MHLGGRENLELHHGHNHLMQYSTLPTLKSSRLKDNFTMSKTEAQIVSYGILYFNPSS